MPDTHIDISAMQSQLAQSPNSSLKFYFEGESIKAGYHVTEVKYANIKSIDCGRSSEIENWDEITVQLVDGSHASIQGHIPSSKFLGIISGALKKLEEEAAPKLFFEYAPNNGPIRKLSIASINVHEDEIAVSLGGEKAVCKPFQRVKDKATSVITGCCGSNGGRGGETTCCG